MENAIIPLKYNSEVELYQTIAFMHVSWREFMSEVFPMIFLETGWFWVFMFNSEKYMLPQYGGGPYLLYRVPPVFFSRPDFKRFFKSAA